MPSDGNLSHACDPQRPGDLILGVRRDDGLGRELIYNERARELPGLEAVTEVARLDDLILEFGSGQPAVSDASELPGRYHFTLLNVPEGEEHVAATSLIQLRMTLAERSASDDLPRVIAQPNHYLDFDASSAAQLTPDHARYIADLGFGQTVSAPASTHPRVRVIDSGYSGPATVVLARNLLDGNTDVQDSLGHGSAVADIIDSCIAGHGEFEIFKVADVTRKPTEWEVLQALSIGPIPPIVNLSLSLGFGRATCKQCGRQRVGARTAVFEERLRELSEAGVIVVAAAGNKRADRLAYPSRFGSTVAVMASSGTPVGIAPYSNHGATDQAGRPHLQAFVCPGGDRDAGEGPAKDAAGELVDGTSYATAYMTAVLTELWARKAICHEGCAKCRERVLATARASATSSFAGFDAGQHGCGLARLQ